MENNGVNLHGVEFDAVRNHWFTGVDVTTWRSLASVVVHCGHVMLRLRAAPASVMLTPASVRPHLGDAVGHVVVVRKPGRLKRLQHRRVDRGCACTPGRHRCWQTQVRFLRCVHKALGMRIATLAHYCRRVHRPWRSIFSRPGFVKLDVLKMNPVPRLSKIVALWMAGIPGVVGG